jgi:ABC-type amino acid transport substrate-binding protein
VVWHVIAIAISLIAAAPAFAQSAKPPSDSEQLRQREIVVGTKEVAPFSMKSPDGEWTGISIELWRRIAEKQGIKYRFEDLDTVPAPALIDATAAGKVDIAVAALTVTAGREEMLDFTSAFYGTGLGIAVPTTTGIAG